MPQTATAPQPFLGLAWYRWPQQWRAAAALLAAHAPARWLLPQVRITLLRADGSRGVWRWNRGVALPARNSGDADDAALTALELPAEQALLRTLTLPSLPADELAHAVALDVAANSPFAPADTRYGYVSDAGAAGAATRVQVAISAQAYVAQALERAGSAAGAAPEVWVLPPAAHAPAGVATGALRPIVLQGTGDGARLRAVRRGCTQRTVVLVLVLALLAGLAITPAVLMRARAAQARQALAALQHRVAPQLQQREALAQRLERLQQVRQVLAGQLAPPPVLDLLTRALPANAWLTAVRIEGDKVVLNGQADDATTVVQLLAAEPGAHGVHLASPATRRANAAQEIFVIELTLDAAHYGPVAIPAADAESAAPHPADDTPARAGEGA